MPPTCSCSRFGPLCEECQTLECLRPMIRATVTGLARGYGVFLREEDREDIAQDVMLALVQAGHTREIPAALFEDIARKRLIDWIRKSASQRCCCSSDLLAEMADSHTLSDTALIVMEALDRMPDPKMRAVFIALGIEKRCFRETVVLVGLSLHTVRQLYEAALRIAAEVLDIELPEAFQSPRAKKSVSDDIAG
jgi:DNA-directed RNA polymerase specialized sigma24 family protein